MAINTKKVLVGGLAAGVVNVALGFGVFAMMLAPRFNAELDAAMPGASAKMSAGTMNMVIAIVSPFIIGWLLAWLYAAIRPRFGPGPKTATYAALVVWLCGFLFYADGYQMGAMSGASYMIAAVSALVINIIVAQVAAFLYKEEGA